MTKVRGSRIFTCHHNVKGEDVDFLVVLDHPNDSDRDAVSDRAFAVLEAKGFYIHTVV